MGPNPREGCLDGKGGWGKGRKAPRAPAAKRVERENLPRVSGGSTYWLEERGLQGGRRREHPAALLHAGGSKREKTSFKKTEEKPGQTIFN